MLIFISMVMRPHHEQAMVKPISRQHRATQHLRVIKGTEKGPSVLWIRWAMRCWILSTTGIAVVITSAAMLAIMQQRRQPLHGLNWNIHLNSTLFDTPVSAHNQRPAPACSPSGRSSADASEPTTDLLPLIAFGNGRIR